MAFADTRLMTINDCVRDSMIYWHEHRHLEQFENQGSVVNNIFGIISLSAIVCSLILLSILLIPNLPDLRGVFLFVLLLPYTCWLFSELGADYHGFVYWYRYRYTRWVPDKRYILVNKIV